MVRDQTFKRIYLIHELRNFQQTVNIGAGERTEVLSLKKKINKEFWKERCIC